MQVHPDSGPHCLLYSLRLFNAVELNLNRIKLPMHLNDWTFIVIIGESFGI